MSAASMTLTRTQAGMSPSLRLAVILSAVIVVLVAVAAAAGLFIPDLYRDPVAVTVVNQGTDLVTLLATLALAVALLGVRRGSARATLLWIGLLGYVFYICTVAAFAYTFNALFLLYVLLFSLSVFALIAAAIGADASAIQKSFGEATPRGPVAVFLLLSPLSWLWENSLRSARSSRRASHLHSFRARTRLPIPSTPWIWASSCHWLSWQPSGSGAEFPGATS